MLLQPTMTHHGYDSPVEQCLLWSNDVLCPPANKCDDMSNRPIAMHAMGDDVSSRPIAMPYAYGMLCQMHSYDLHVEPVFKRGAQVQESIRWARATRVISESQ